MNYEYVFRTFRSLIALFLSKENASLQSSDQSCQTEFLNPDYNMINQMWKIGLNKGTDVDV